MKVKNILFFVVFFAFIGVLDAQETQEELNQKTFRERLTFNIGGGLMFGTYTSVNIMPQVGYRATPKITIGVGGNFNYFRDNRYTPPVDFTMFGGNAFARYQILDNLFAQTEYQRLYHNGFGGDYVLVGGGFMPSNNFYISGYYLLKYPSNNVYGQPYLIRAGVMF